MKNVGEKSTKSFLLDFGLTDKEVTIYLTLLKVGPSTIMDLARETGIKRSTTHNNVEELIKKGLVSQTNYGERRMVIAEDPEKLKFLMEQKKWDMKKLEDNLPTAIKSIMDSVPQAKENSKAEVRYYQGELGFKEASERSLDRSTDEILFISNPEEWNKVFTEEYDREVYIPKRLKKGVKVRTLVSNTAKGALVKENDKNILRETRLLPTDFHLKPTIAIYHGEVSFMLSSEPYTSIVIESPELSEAFTNIFNFVWGSVK